MGRDETRTTDDLSALEHELLTPDQVEDCRENGWPRLVYDSYVKISPQVQVLIARTRTAEAERDANHVHACEASIEERLQRRRAEKAEAERDALQREVDGLRAALELLRNPNRERGMGSSGNFAPSPEAQASGPARREP